MKKYIILLFSVLTIIGSTSCQYEEVASSIYPEGLIYLPSAINGVYAIDQLTTEDMYNPTPGSVFRYQANKEANRFEVPLSIYRSGLNPGNAVSVEVLINTDTITKLIQDNILADTEILPVEKYSIDRTTLFLKKGETLSDFSVAVDFGYIKSRAPQKFAFGLTVSCSEQEVNPQLNTVIVLIDTKILIPQVAFSYSNAQENPAKITFTNESMYATSHLWNFGDGYTSTEVSPVHTYSTPGTYDVELIITGLYGDTDKIKKTIEVN